MSESSEFSITLTQETDYVFRIAFDESSIADLQTDEPAPLGSDSGPNPSRLLVAAVANCLSASLVFALRKYKNSAEGMVTHATAKMERNEQNRLRIGQIAVTIKLPDAASDYAHIDRLLQQFENFCIVTESVRSGVPVTIRVQDVTESVLHDSAAHSTPSATG